MENKAEKSPIPNDGSPSSDRGVKRPHSNRSSMSMSPHQQQPAVSYDTQKIKVEKSESVEVAKVEKVEINYSVERCSSVVSVTSTSQGLTYCSEILRQMNEFRESNILCDALICVDGKTFPAHRTVLASASPYFKALFSSNLGELNVESKPIVVSDIDTTNMTKLLQYIYTGEIELTEENIKPIISAANYLLISSLKDRCTRFLQRMLTPSNCLGIESTALKYDCEALRDSATSYIRDNFIPISNSDEFMELDFKRLTDLVSSDDTKVDCEEQIFEAIMKWVNHDLENRKHTFKELVNFVRFPLISPYYLMDHVESEELVRNTPECISLLLEAKNYHMLPDRRWQLKSKRTTPRVSMGLLNGIIAVGGIQGPCKLNLHIII